MEGGAGLRHRWHDVNCKDHAQVSFILRSLGTVGRLLITKSKTSLLCMEERIGRSREREVPAQREVGD